MMNDRACVRTALLCSVAIAAPISMASAQTAGGVPPPTRYVLDSNGVNLATGEQFLGVTELMIGSKDAGLALSAVRGAHGSGSNFVQFVYTNGATWSATVPSSSGSRSYQFTLSGGVYTSTTGEQATLTSGAGGYVLTLADGTQYTYAELTLVTADGGTQRKARLTQILDSSGEKLTLTYNNVEYCAVNNQDPCQNANIRTKIRLQSVSSSYGYQLQYSYASNQANTAQQGAIWDQLNSVTAFNLAVDYCAPSASTCSFTQTWPSASYTTTLSGYDTIVNVTTAGKTTRYTNTAGTGVPTTYKVKRPASSADDMIVTITSGRVSSVNNDGQVTNYAWSLSGNLLTATITNPDTTTRTVISDVTVGLPTSVKDELARTTTYQYDAQGRLTKAIAPEGNYTKYTYDDATQRGNLTETRLVSKTPGTPVDIVTTAGYPTSCSNAKTCNQPSWTKDALGNQSDYTYDATHGGTLTVTQPAVTVNGSSVRPQVRYGYSALQAYYKNAAGSIVASGATVYRQTSVSSCQTSASCANLADEVRAVTSYGPQTAGTANNLLPVSVTRGSGAAFQANDTANLATTTFGYDLVGNAVTVDGPLAGSADTTTYRYNAAHQVIGVISPDPDSAGPLLRRATRVTMNDNLQPTLIEQGTVTGTTDTDWANFVTLQQQSIAYDVAARPTSASIVAGGTTYAVTQTTYDTRGRVDCSATRLNSAAWGSLPASACTLQTAGSDGPDRVTKMTYTSAGEVKVTTSAYGTSDQADDATLSYTPNGKQATVTDAQGNVTSYAYDGFDRLLTTTYVGGSYEQLGYDANGNVTSRRLRDAKSIGFGYDALNRRTSTTFNNPVDITDSNVSYGYDLLGHMTLAQDVNGHLVGYAYDALGRATSENSRWSTLASQYDLAGRRTRLTWSDGFYVTYEYDNTDAMTAIRENGGFVLASFGYDNLGRRASRTLGNGTSTSYGYDNVSRLTALNLNGGAQTNATTLGYNAAGQITSRTASNDGFAWTGASNVDRSYTVNGLNQYTASGSVVPTYDGRGNVTSAGGSTYLYNSKNQLSGANGTYIYYDPAGRLDQVTQSGLRWDWDGGRLVTERQLSDTIIKRYVHGPGVDEPIVAYNGSGTGSRTWLDADERGSIVRITDDAGNAVSVNAYDEYGIPASGNTGRFQYTGQIWMPELGFQYSKARMYSPTLGRFMQTDPIGYGDGINWYNYVGSDPVNFRDPTGLLTFLTCSVQGYSYTDASGQVIVVAYQTCSEIDANISSINNEHGLMQIPDPTAAPHVTVPQKLPDQPKKNCLENIDAKTWAGLGVDLLGVGASFIPGGKGLVTAGAAVVGSTTGIVSIGLGISSHSTAGAGSVAIGTAGHYTSVATGLMDGAKGIAGYLPVAGQALAVGGLIYDGINALSDAGCFGGDK